MTTGPPAMTELLARWGIPAHAELVRAERGTNNQTFAVVLERGRWALRISENLTAEQIHAEHRLLARLRGAGLPSAVPAPVPTLAGGTVTDTPAGPAPKPPAEPRPQRLPQPERPGRGHSLPPYAPGA